MFDSLWPHGLQHARLACPSPTPRVYSNSCPLSWWCHPSNHLILCHPLFLLPSIFPRIRVFSHESVLCIRWPNYWNFNFNISPFREYSGLISFRMVWLDLLAIQGTFKSSSTPQFKSILRHSAFFTVQLSHPYVTTGKTIALTRWTFVDKVISLLFNLVFISGFPLTCRFFCVPQFPQSPHLDIRGLDTKSSVMPFDFSVQSRTAARWRSSKGHQEHQAF